MYDQYIVGFMMIGGIGLGIRHGKHKILCDIKHCGYKRKKKFMWYSCTSHVFQ